MNATKDEIAGWCRAYVADLLQVPADTIDPAEDFDRLGVDSALAVSLLMEVEERYGVDLEPEELFADPTLDAVADHVLAQIVSRVA
ncbi:MULTISPECIES: acyl carrier protein [unclassified Pseudonocardia]|uniref:acyl carrier protein n=1 Tax=unclassified Pseudonocardia TaxID=2619320 RepID=UPI000964043C|nr:MULTISPECIES: acyl carrier protein [unclassified Pseudonocardia]OJY38502.1 MAG: phosphopantetheine-binding protein [Pseudonocardia sp. 73-21]